MIVLAISVVSIIGMCPLMSLAATLLFKNAGSQFIAVWLETTRIEFPNGILLAALLCRSICQKGIRTLIQRKVISFSFSASHEAL